ncbi:hypothetical protein [Psychroserpens ponticola]|uniref:Uncharacterized protein n=1 Tax=Psychroserpens ponticola TaxID=2932268 RepID=A0ABY7RZI7_9FLAO|nr:hypothetical protein [Psychroserpens ponticola]WCO02120.1 hypothetical protein MUN68_001220 [Psychroserpens ponticola]
MRHLIYIYFLFSMLLNSQESIDATLIKSTDLKIDQIIALDNFETFYYLQHNTIYKQDKNGTSINYSNYQLGEITTANTFNPLKINLFYQDFNMVVILDNRLAEIFKIDFNTIHPYKNISHVSTGFDNTLWVFNMDFQQLELFDYKTNKTRFSAVPVQSEVLDLVSDYNYCWLLTKKYLYQYNYFGSMISKIENTGFTKITKSNGHLIFKKEDHLYFKHKKKEDIVPINLPKLLINQFLLTNETLYIYDLKKLHKYQLKIN